jgi:hypothetical protein
MMSKANVTKHVTIGHENGPRRSLRGPFPLVAGTLVAGTVSGSGDRIRTCDLWVMSQPVAVSPNTSVS